MRNRAHLPNKKRVRRGHGMEEVSGSTPLSSTTTKLKPTSQIVEIPKDYSVVTAADWDGNNPRLFRVLVKGNPK